MVRMQPRAAGVRPSPAQRAGVRTALLPGMPVVYRGAIPGGPPYGAAGWVKSLRVLGAMVDFGELGTWQVPRHLLRPLEAGLSSPAGAARVA